MTAVWIIIEWLHWGKILEQTYKHLFLSKIELYSNLSDAHACIHSGPQQTWGTFMHSISNVKHPLTAVERPP